MKRNATESNAVTTGNARFKTNCSSGQSHNKTTFSKVLDGRKQPIRGLWLRNTRFYAQLTVENPITGIKKTSLIPLKDKDGAPVKTASQAVDELRRLQTKRRDGNLQNLGKTPKFADYVKRYTDFISSGKGTKKASSVAKEKAILERWVESIGSLNLDQIKRIHVNRFIEKRLKTGVAPRTLNLDVIALRCVMKRALGEGIIQRLPTEGLRPLKTSTHERSLFSSAELDVIFKTAFQLKKDKSGSLVPLTENAGQIVDYIKFMAYCGARRNEALGVRWSDIDFGNQQLHLRRQITDRGIEDLKNREMRVVDFNPKLRVHLLGMLERRVPDSVWLFPSPQRGEKDIPTKTFKESLNMVRAAAGMPHFNFHDCRHHFISMCVMSGIDFMTIAAWVGHKDGGILIGKVYGHLANEHRKRMADKLNFEPIPVEAVADQ